MAVLWRTNHAIPIPLGGAAELVAALDGTGVSAVRAVLAEGLVAAWDDVPFGAVAVDLVQGRRGEWSGVAWSAPRNAHINWFARVDGAWVTGPVYVAALPCLLQAQMPVPLQWVVDRLSDYAAGVPPLGDRHVLITQAFPRDESLFPVISVQVDALNQSGRSVGDFLASTGPTVNPPNTATHGSVYDLSLGVTCWAATPEDRRALTPWLACALEALILCSRWNPEIHAPSSRLTEHEDFQTLQRPLFLTQGSFNCSVISRLSVPVSNAAGRLTIS